MERIHFLITILVVTISFSGAGLAQFGTGVPINAEPIADGPAPIRDLSDIFLKFLVDPDPS